MILTILSSDPNLTQWLSDADLCGFNIRVIWSDYDRAFLAACGWGC